MINYEQWFTMGVINYMKIIKRVILSTHFFYSAIVGLSSVGLAKNICMTRECNETAAEIARNINLGVLPCHNFFQFACGKFIRNVDSRRETHILSLIQSYLEQNPREEKNKRFQKVFTLYRLCKAQNANAGGLNFLRHIIDKIGGWPMLEGENWKENKWENVTGELSQLNYNFGIFFYPKMVAYPGGMNIILMESMPFKLSNESAEGLAQIAIEMGANPNKISKQSFMNTFSYFGSLNNYTKNQYHAKPFTIYTLKSLWPSIDWVTYFTGYYSNLSAITIDEAHFVYADEEHINEIVKIIEKTPKSVIIDYVIAHIIEKLLPYLHREIALKSNIKSNEKAENPLLVWNKFCANVTTQEFPRMAHALLYVNYFDGEIQNEFNSIGRSVINKMAELIHRADWLDEQATKIYTKRLSNLTYGIWNFNTIGIDEYIGENNDLILDERNFYYAMLSIATFPQNSEYQKLINTSMFSISRSKYQTDIEEHIDEVNGVYYPDENRVDISMGTILNPFFKKNCPKYVNYSGLGLLLGHEIAHGFSLREVYDYIANYSDLNPAIRDELFDRIDCFVAQYDNIITDMRTPINGTMTVAENTADFLGIRLAYLIYKDWTEHNPSDPALYDLDYTTMQMFWISLAQNQCIYGLNITTGPDDEFHSPENYRLNQALSNIPEFSDAFGCSLGSPMNPEKKCILW